MPRQCYELSLSGGVVPQLHETEAELEELRAAVPEWEAYVQVHPPAVFWMLLQIAIVPNVVESLPSGTLG